MVAQTATLAWRIKPCHRCCIHPIVLRTRAMGAPDLNCCRCWLAYRRRNKECDAATVDVHLCAFMTASKHRATNLTIGPDVRSAEQGFVRGLIVYFNQRTRLLARVRNAPCQDWEPGPIKRGDRRRRCTRGRSRAVVGMAAKPSGAHQAGRHRAGHMLSQHAGRRGGGGAWSGGASPPYMDGLQVWPSGNAPLRDRR